jgi:hypothetical protein
LDPFETRQRLRQEDVLSTLLFNVVLETTQITGTIFNKQIQLIAYASDIDIVGMPTIDYDAYLAL